ncbi:MAG TPA: flotillin-like FloA family protein, partial [Verrucomicrobiae bacterium]|nr:flotillin-like FloA family protein [Verrucomicrobiae bacterium]
MKSNLIELADIPSMGVIVAGIVLLVVLVMGIVLLNFGMIYIRALFSGAKAKISELIALRLRRVPVGLIVDNRITAVKSGLDISIDDLSTHFMAGGNVEMVVQALIAARKAGIHLVFDRACAIDLATKGT